MQIVEANKNVNSALKHKNKNKQNTQKRSIDLGAGGLNVDWFPALCDPTGDSEKWLSTSAQLPSC